MYQLELTFRFIENNGNIQLWNSGERCYADERDLYKHTQSLLLPSMLRFEMRGKDPHGKDTKVDANGNILWDRHIILEECRIDKTKANENFLKRWPRIHPSANLDNFVPSNQIIFSNYFGFNGVIELDFDGNNLIEWYMRTHKHRDDDWQKNYDI